MAEASDDAADRCADGATAMESDLDGRSGLGLAIVATVLTKGPQWSPTLTAVATRHQQRRDDPTLASMESDPGGRSDEGEPAACAVAVEASMESGRDGRSDSSPKSGRLTCDDTPTCERSIERLIFARPESHRTTERRV